MGKKSDNRAAPTITPGLEHGIPRPECQADVFLAVIYLCREEQNGVVVMNSSSGTSILGCKAKSKCQRKRR